MEDIQLFAQATALAAAAVVFIQQVLKLNVIPGTFATRWPVQTNVVLSLIAALVVSPINWSALVPAVVLDVLLQAGTIAVAAAIVYNQLVRPAVKPTEPK